MKPFILPEPYQVLEQRWEHLHERGDLRATLPPAHRGLPSAEQKLRWLQMRLGGRRRSAWDELRPAELRYINELLTQGRTRLDEALAAEFRAQKIGVPELWFEALKTAVRHSRLAWNYGGRAYHEMNRLDKLHLLRVLRSRNTGA